MDIKIGKSARNCAACGRPFEHTNELRSMLRIEDGEFIRDDYCPACWKPDRRIEAYCTWMCKFWDPKVAEEQPPEAFSPLRRVFYEAVERQGRTEMSVAYLAAQLLRRQKAFRLVKESDASEEDGRVTLFMDRIGDRLIEVRDPDLTHDELEQGRQILMERLNELEAEEEGTQTLSHAES
jgi:hypothetical protein